jgi:hypothetical protein
VSRLQIESTIIHATLLLKSYSIVLWELVQPSDTRGGIDVCSRTDMGLHHTNAGSTAIVGTNDEIYAGAKMDQWRALAAKHGSSLEAVAIAFAALPSVVSKVVLGMKSAKEVEINVKAAAEAEAVPVEIWAEAQAAGLIIADVVVPK